MFEKHMILTISSSFNSEREFDRFIEKSLDELDQEGWEAVSCDFSFYPKRVLILMRRKTEK